MSQQIGSYTFPSSTVNRMKKLVDKTQKTQKEHAFSLCVDKNDKSSTPRIHYGVEHREQSKNGDSKSIKFQSSCRERSHEHIGTFHTHITTKASEPSALDIFNNCHPVNNIDCIGSRVDNRIVCMKKNIPRDDCQTEVKHLVEEEDVLLSDEEEANIDANKLYSNLGEVINKHFEVKELKL